MDLLASFSYGTFRNRVGERFVLAAGGLELELVEVVDRGAGTEPPSGARAPFSLVFRGPAEPALPQGIQDISHAELGEFGLFVVPIAREADGMRYEAAFS